MQYSDHILILKIGSDEPREANKALRQIHEQSFEMICRWICKNNGTRSDAQDIFQEVCINLVKNIRSNKLERKAKLTTYNFRVAQNLWYKKLRKSGRNIPLDTFADTLEHPNDIEEKLMIEERDTIIHKYLTMLTSREEQVLRLHYFEQKKMTEIAKIMGFKSEQSAKNFKCKAFKKLKLSVLASGESTALRIM